MIIWAALVGGDWPIANTNPKTTLSYSLSFIDVSLPKSSLHFYYLPIHFLFSCGTFVYPYDFSYHKSKSYLDYEVFSFQLNFFFYEIGYWYFIHRLVFPHSLVPQWDLSGYVVFCFIFAFLVNCAFSQHINFSFYSFNA